MPFVNQSSDVESGGLKQFFFLARLTVEPGLDASGFAPMVVDVEGVRENSAPLAVDVDGEQAVSARVVLDAYHDSERFISTLALDAGVPVLNDARVSLDVDGASGTYLIVDIVDFILANSGGDMEIKVTRTYVRGNDRITQTQTLETDDDLSRDVEVAASAVDFAVPCSFDHDALKVLVLVADKDVTIKMNSTSSPANTFTLKATLPYIWTADSGVANPLTADVTTFYVTNPGVDKALFQIRLSL